jgi:hypothetical protein
VKEPTLSALLQTTDADRLYSELIPSFGQATKSPFQTRDLNLARDKGLSVRKSLIASIGPLIDILAEIIRAGPQKVVHPHFSGDIWSSMPFSFSVTFR